MENLITSRPWIDFNHGKQKSLIRVIFFIGTLAGLTAYYAMPVLPESRPRQSAFQAKQVSMKLIFLGASATVFLLAIGGCQKEKSAPAPQNTASFFTDPRDGEVYRILEIDGRVWFTRNLNYETVESEYYDHDDIHGGIYGRLYFWAQALLVCPPGWHLASDEEWKALTLYYGGYYDNLQDLTYGDPGPAYRALIKGGSSGFDALLGGAYTYHIPGVRGPFYGLGEFGNYWAATDAEAGIYYRFSEKAEEIIRHRDKKLEMTRHSCRCVRDN